MEIPGIGEEAEKRVSKSRLGLVIAAIFLTSGLIVGSFFIGRATKSDDPKPPATGFIPPYIPIPTCPTNDTVVPYAPVGVPTWLRRNYQAVYPVVPGTYALEGFRFVDGDSGLMDASMLFEKDDVFAGVPGSKAWCNTAGEQTFRIQFFGLCQADSDADWNYFWIIAQSGLGNDCMGRTLPGNCRRVRVSKAESGMRQWVESQDGAPNGGTIEVRQGGPAVQMLLKWSMCPTEFTSISVNATW